MLKNIKTALFVIAIISWFVWDISQASEKINSLFQSFKYEKEYDAVTSATTKVSIVRSDDSELTNSTSIDNENITYETIEEMVRRSIELAGGLDWLIKSGDMVLLKPNIVDADPSGNGEVTDIRVIKAVIKIVNDLAPGNIEIVIGEGSPVPIDYELEYDEYYNYALWDKLWDKTGYQDLLVDPYLDGINYRLSNLNCTMPGSSWNKSDGWPPDSAWQDMILMDVPGGGEALPQGGKYWLHKDIINADVFITIPVMKIHTTGMTAALKNQIGIAPSTIYGFWKQMGVPQNDYQYKLIHQYQAPKWWTDKEIVDLANLAKIDFAVVDAIGTLEREKDAMGGHNFVRMNTIVAGADPVAVDNVCSRLMGLNPDDVEHITLAEKVGLGTNDPEKIILKGADLKTTKRKFIKSYFEGGEFGQGNRNWLLNGAFSIDGISTPIDHEFIADEKNLNPEAGNDEWSEDIYFTDNRIDLKDYYSLQSSDEVISYSFSYFTAPKNQSAELWIGTEEAIKIYINGEEVFRFNGNISLPDDEFTNFKKLINIKEGENSLLIKSLQKYGRYDFCINICEPEDDDRYDGNRIYGLKFYTESTATDIAENEVESIKSFKLHGAYPNPFNPSTKIQYSIPKSGVVTLVIYNSAGQKVKTLIDSRQGRGRHIASWDGKNSKNNTVSTGIYFANLQFSGKMETKKLMLLK